VSPVSGLWLVADSRLQ